jgi:hypothetical protein
MVAESQTIQQPERFVSFESPTRKVLPSLWHFLVISLRRFQNLLLRKITENFKNIYLKLFIRVGWRWKGHVGELGRVGVVGLVGPGFIFLLHLCMN